MLRGGGGQADDAGHTKNDGIAALGIGKGLPQRASPAVIQVGDS